MMNNGKVGEGVSRDGGGKGHLSVWWMQASTGLVLVQLEDEDGDEDIGKRRPEIRVQLAPEDDADISQGRLP